MWGEDHIPISFDILGSNDSVRWHLLRRVENDDSLIPRPHAHVWPLGIDYGGAPISSSRNGGYRLIRIRQTAPSSSGKLFLVLSKVELFGALYRIRQR